MISKSTIDTVYETARVEEVIGEFVQLKRSGSNYKGLSPFSDERTPSFMVSPTKQIWKDFSSGKGGNVVAFLMEHEHFTYPEAIRYLAKKYNIAIEETERTDEEKAVADQKESLYLVSEYAQKYFQDILWNSEDGKAIGLTYFKERGFTNDTIKKFQLGYSPEVWNAFSQEALGKGYKLEFLQGTGLTIVREDGSTADRFRGRVMFPIHSLSGRVLGFGGRTLTSDKKVAKYLNSPESDIYHKSKVLYGIYFAKAAIAKHDNCFLVEGYTDVIQFMQSGIENVVSSSGTALTPDQIRLINRLTKNITVLFDGDAAGLRASLRGIDLILEQGMNVRVCTFPDGEDPDSFAKKHTQAELTEYLSSNATDFISFKASLLMQHAKHDPIKKADTIRDMVASISKIPDRIQREIYIRETSRIMDISEQVLMSSLAQLVQKEISDAGKKLKQEQKSHTFEVVRNEPQALEKIDIRDLLERKIIEILLLYGERVETWEDVLMKTNDDGEIEEVIQKTEMPVYRRVFLALHEDETQLTNPVFQAIYQDVMDYFNQAEEFSIEQYLQRVPTELQEEVTSILMHEERETLHNWEIRQIFVKQKDQTIAQYVTETILTLRWYLVSGIIDELKTEIKPDVDNSESLELIMDYGKLVQSFAKKLGRVMSRYH